MKTVAPVLLVALLLPAAVRAQDEVPAGLAAVESARSAACVGSLARLADLNRRLDPFALRMQRLRALGAAISLEDTVDVAPFSASDSVEIAVANWFQADQAMALRMVAAQDSATMAQRAAARVQILDLVRGNMAAVNTQAQAEMGDAQQIEADALPCEGTIFVRPAVIEACSEITSDLCDAAKGSEPQDAYRFVDAPSDIWDVEDYRPWTEPTGLQAAPDGSLTGARTAARGRKGNIVLIVGLAPIIRPRASITPEEAAEFDANLDSLGFTFDHPDFVMAPALEFQANVPAPMAGETHYLLHFGDLTGDDVIWSLPAGESGVIQASFPASATDLARLQRGDVVSLTAVKVAEGEVTEGEGPQAEPVYTIPLLQMSQSQSVNLLLQYMAGGDLSRDLTSLLPPAGGAGTGRQ
ncbi:MAG TPA: hypothetical protein VLA36_01105 [Longimicrobiales bacterium]|nr:hypothetical protein [Longimicrobiales bacterium]